MPSFAPELETYQRYWHQIKLNWVDSPSANNVANTTTYATGTRLVWHLCVARQKIGRCYHNYKWMNYGNISKSYNDKLICSQKNRNEIQNCHLKSTKISNTRSPFQRIPSINSMMLFQWRKMIIHWPDYLRFSHTIWDWELIIPTKTNP